MNVFLTFDVEIWCRSWSTLDGDFPRAFRRYVFGESKHGQYALPYTLELLDRYGLRGVFFVEPLFAARFGIEHLATVVQLLRAARQEIQLHLHPEWTDEISPPPIPNVASKRQHLCYYSVEEQTALITYGLRLLREAGVDSITAFRAGSFAANADTFDAVRTNGIKFDSSVNASTAVSAPDLQRHSAIVSPCSVKGVSVYPLTVLRDGLGRLRPAQVGACSAREMEQALEDAARRGATDFVILSHNFEMLKPDSSEPDWVVVRRFEALCRVLDRNRHWRNIGFAQANIRDNQPGNSTLVPRVGRLATGVRLVEQVLRRATAIRASA